MTALAFSLRRIAPRHYGYGLVWPTILRLLPPSGPANIARLVIPVHVDAIKRMLWGWATAYRLQEVLVVIESKCDSATPIVGVILRRRAVTPNTCSYVGPIFGSECGVVAGFAVLKPSI